MSKRRVVITGLGAVSSVGNTAEETWQAVKAGKSGASHITLFDAADFPVQIAAEVKDFSLDAYNVNHKLSRKMSRFAKFLLGAGIQAVNDSGLSSETLASGKTGIVTGIGIGLSDGLDAGYRKYFDPNAGVNRLPPLTAPLSLNNEASANVSMYFGIKGPSWTISTACASGSDAIGLGMDMIRSGRIDVCLAGGTDANITGFNIGCYQVLQALTQNFNDAPEKASRPFDKNRSGFVMGEGSAVLVLEELEPVGGHLHKVGEVAVDLFYLSLDARHKLVGLVLVELQDTLHLDFEELEDVILSHLAHKLRIIRSEPLVDMLTDGIHVRSLFELAVLVYAFLNEYLLKRGEVELFEQFALAYLEFLAEQVLGVIYRMAEHVADSEELRLVVLDDAAVGRDVHLAVGEGIEGVERLVG